MSAEKNWNNLSVKLKCRCLMDLDFKTRYRYRRTSKSEMSIIDSLPIRFERITVTNEDENPCSSVVIVQDENNKFAITSRQLYFKQETIIPLLNYILEKGRIEKFIVRRSEEVEVFSNGQNLEDNVAMKWEISRFLREMKDSLRELEELLKPKTNWNDLPSELKIECIDYMPLMDRWNLRQTAHLERDLVNSQRGFAETVIVDEKFFSFTTKTGIGNFFISYEYNRGKQNRICPLITFALQKLSVNVLKIDVEQFEMAYEITSSLSENETLEVQTIIFDRHVGIDLYHWFRALKKCVNIVIIEREHGRFYIPFHYSNIATIPAVLEAETTQYIAAKNIEALESLLKTLIEQPPKLNSEFQMSFLCSNSIEPLSKMDSCVESHFNEEPCDMLFFKTSDPEKVVFVIQFEKQREVFMYVFPSNDEPSLEFSGWKNFGRY